MRSLTFSQDLQLAIEPVDETEGLLIPIFSKRIPKLEKPILIGPLNKLS
jgi:hypothetical protein